MTACVNCGVCVGRMAECSDGHTLCENCTTNLVIHNLRLADDGPRLPCAAAGCSGVVDLIRAMHTVNMEAVRKISNAMLEHERAKSIDLMITALKELRAAVATAVPPAVYDDVVACEVPTEARMTKEQTRIAIGSDAWECPECAYGPVLHANCDDLRAHDGDEVSYDVIVNNGCPRCGFFAENIYEWNTWSGTVCEISEEERAHAELRSKKRQSERTLNDMRSTNANTDAMLSMLVETVQCSEEDAAAALTAVVRQHGFSHECPSYEDEWSATCSTCQASYVTALEKLTEPSN